MCSAQVFHSRENLAFVAGSDKVWNVYYSTSEITDFSQWNGRQDGTEDADTVARVGRSRKAIHHGRQSDGAHARTQPELVSR